MDEYIEKQKAIEALGEEPQCWIDAKYNCGPRDKWRWDIKAISEVPPADVRPVVRGHWIDTDSGLWQCSNPKCKMAYKARLLYIKPNFCPNCGADMREE